MKEMMKRTEDFKKEEAAESKRMSANVHSTVHHPSRLLTASLRSLMKVTLLLTPPCSFAAYRSSIFKSAPIVLTQLSNSLLSSFVGTVIFSNLFACVKS